MKHKIQSGIYIVIDPAQNEEIIVRQLSQIKEETIAAVQIWDNPKVECINKHLFDDVLQMFKGKAPVLINNNWELLESYEFDGVHFDKIPENFDEIVSSIKRRFIKGLTLTNDLSFIEEAKRLNFDYFSFCAMFPSNTVDSCEIVSVETVKECSKLTTLPIFLSGGITPKNLKSLHELPFQGIAVVSGIMNAAHPKDVFKKYLLELNKL